MKFPPDKETDKANRSSNRKVLLNLFSDYRGVTAIEFALVAPVLFTIFFAIIELGLSMLVDAVLDNAVAEAARQIKTGQVFFGDYNETQFKNVVLENGAGLLKTVEDKIFIDVMSYKDFGNIPQGPKPIIEDGEIVMEQNWKPGQASDVVVVQVVCLWPMITSKMVEIFGQAESGSRILVATEIFKNEPFR